jgi:uncharacterized protein
LDSDDYDPLYLRGIAEFNQQLFFESHETWECLWKRQLGPSREFFQGLIQAAVALHHLRNRNEHGAGTLLARSRAHLDPYRPRYLGVDVDGFLAALDDVFLGVAGPGGGAGRAVFDRERLPQIRLNQPGSGPRA